MSLEYVAALNQDPTQKIIKEEFFQTSPAKAHGLSVDTCGLEGNTYVFLPITPYP